MKPFHCCSFVIIMKINTTILLRRKLKVFPNFSTIPTSPNIQFSTLFQSHRLFPQPPPPPPPRLFEDSPVPWYLSRIFKWWKHLSVWKNRREKVTKFWLGDETFPRPKVPPTKGFPRPKVSPDQRFSRPKVFPTKGFPDQRFSRPKVSPTKGFPDDRFSRRQVFPDKVSKIDCIFRRTPQYLFTYNIQNLNIHEIFGFCCYFFFFFPSSATTWMQSGSQ